MRPARTKSVFADADSRRRAEFADPAARLLAQERAQCDSIAVADGGGDLIDRILRRPQSVDRGLDAQILDVRQGRLAEDGADTTLESALARADTARGFLESEGREVAARPRLEALHERVGVRE